ncbi:MAG: class I SAM-dependent methyltransferase [Candidatus Methanoperedens sp.]|nr:class I SAM-dependent methyltransferase [Candidatus Methanoperedens sp.]
MISGIEKFYCKSRLHAYIWKYIANNLFSAFIPYFPASPFVLEIGTGQGLGAIFLAEKLKDSGFVAIDYEHDMVKAAIENVNNRGLYDRINVEWGDAAALNFPDESFDAVTSICVLHHVPGYEKAISEAARVLKRGGIFMIVDFDLKASRIFSSFEILFGRAASIFSWKEMSDALKKAGLEILKVEFHGMGMFASVCVKR